MTATNRVHSPSEPTRGTARAGHGARRMLVLFLWGTPNAGSVIRERVVPPAPGGHQRPGLSV